MAIRVAATPPKTTPGPVNKLHFLYIILPSFLLSNLDLEKHNFWSIWPFVGNEEDELAQRRLEDKQPEEKTNTDCLVKEREKVHLGIKVGANITVTGVPGQEGAEGGPRFEVPALDEDAEYRLCLSVSPKDSRKVITWSTRDRKAEVFQVSNDDTAVAQRWLEDKQPEEKTNTDCLVKEREKVHLGIKVGANITVTGVPGQEGAEGNVAEKNKGVYES
ncbi:hypothetical protein Tco_0256554 [Tanacetum coccineum]